MEKLIVTSVRHSVNDRRTTVTLKQEDGSEFKIYGLDADVAFKLIEFLKQELQKGRDYKKEDIHLPEQFFIKVLEDGTKRLWFSYDSQQELDSALKGIAITQRELQHRRLQPRQQNKGGIPFGGFKPY